MVQVNSYFEGKVTSLSFNAGGARSTVGVMQIGEFEFNTGAPELMQVIQGELIVKLPGGDFTSYKAGTSFQVPGKSTFYLKVPVETAYLCLFLNS